MKVVVGATRSDFFAVWGPGDGFDGVCVSLGLIGWFVFYVPDACGFVVACRNDFCVV